MTLAFLFSPILIGILAVLCALFLITRDRRTMQKIILMLFVFSFGIGFVLYTLGYLSPDASGSGLIIAALRGLFSAGRMFVMEDDSGNLIGASEAEWLDNIWIQLLFWIVNLLALVVSASALMALFGRKLIGNFRLRFGFRRQVYIILGTEQKALILGKNIATQDGKVSFKADRLVVFLADKVSGAERLYDAITSFGAVLVEGDGDLLAGLGKVGFGKWYARRRSFKIILTTDNTSAVASVEKILKYAFQKHVDTRNLEIFAITKSEWDMKGIEKQAEAYPYSVHITNEASIAARQLLLKHPAFRLLSFENGIASHDFTAVIIGFGNIGQQTLLRLIMNGQFVGSRMRAVIIDTEIENLRGRFLHRYPSLNLCCEMAFHALDVRSEGFYTLLQQIGNVDYVVLTLDDEEQSKQSAQDLQLHYLHAQKTLPFIAVAAENSYVPWENTACFVIQADIYTESALIHEDTDRMAMAVNSVYMRGANTPAEDIYSLWQTLNRFSKDSNRASADFIPAMLHLVGLTPEQAVERDKLTTENENTALPDVLARTEHLRWMAFHAATSYRPMTLDEMRRRFETLPNDDKRLALCRKDAAQKLHLCLVPWEKLDEISKAYNELVQRAGGTDIRDFKADDNQVVQNVPLFLRASIYASHNKAHKTEQL